MLIVSRVLYSHHAVYKLLDKRAILKAILSAIVAFDGRAACLYSARCRSVSRLSQVPSNPTANTIFQCLLGLLDSPPGWPLLPVRPPFSGRPHQPNTWALPDFGRRRPHTYFHVKKPLDSKWYFHTPSSSELSYICQSCRSD
jgi:hypothetical protein